MKKFNERSRQNLSELNKEMLATWEAENLFQRSVAMREGAPSFVFTRVRPPQTVCPAYTM